MWMRGCVVETVGSGGETVGGGDCGFDDEI